MFSTQKNRKICHVEHVCHCKFKLVSSNKSLAPVFIVICLLSCFNGMLYRQFFGNTEGKRGKTYVYKNLEFTENMAILGEKSEMV